MQYEKTAGGKSICPECGYTWVSDRAVDAHRAKGHRRCPECGVLRHGLKQHISHAHSGTRKRRSDSEN